MAERGIGEKIILATGLSADGSGQHVTIGGGYSWITQGSFDAGDEIKLQVLGPDGSTYIDIDGMVIAASKMLNVELPANCIVKTVIVNTPTNYTSWLVKR